MRASAHILAVVALLGISPSVNAQATTNEVLACGGSVEGRTLTVVRAEAKCAWPFNVAKMQIRCNGYAPKSGDVFFVSEKGAFALNGAAKARFNDPRPLWLDQRTAGMGKIDVGPWIEVGLLLC